LNRGENERRMSLAMEGKPFGLGFTISKLDECPLGI